MKKNSTVAIIFAIALFQFARAATLEDFGYANLKAIDQLSIGTRPTLVILLDLANTGTFAHTVTEYDNLVFNPLNNTAAGLRSVNGFLTVNSHGKFRINRAGPGILGPLAIPADQRTKAATNDFMRGAFAIGAAINASFDFAPFDANNDGQIQNKEISIIIIDNLNPNPQGTTKWLNPDGKEGEPFTPSGSTKSIALRAAFVAQRVGFATLCHEFSHAAMNTEDLYGGGNQVVCFNNLYTLMSCTIGANDDLVTVHLDAWHKMQLGWVEPRIRSITAGGVEAISAAQLFNSTDAPVILYDPARGTKEFFLLEYRTSSSSTGGEYEDNLPSNGLGVWHVIHNDSRTLFTMPGTFQSVWLEGQPNLQVATDTNQLWTADTTTPLLQWSNGDATRTRIFVRPFNVGADQITIEWLTESETWVDFSYGGPEQGSFDQPFKTLASAANAASHGGAVIFKTGGFSPETLSINKRLNLRANGGPVTIGP